MEGIRGKPPNVADSVTLTETKKRAPLRSCSAGEQEAYEALGMWRRCKRFGKENKDLDGLLVGLQVAVDEADEEAHEERLSYLRSQDHSVPNRIPASSSEEN
eukprot:753892-Hanusia_phi.AAC.1